MGSRSYRIGVVRHRARTRGEDGDVRTALALHAKLRAFQAFADLVIRNADAALGALRGGLVEQLALHDEFEAIAVETGTKGVQAAKAGQEIEWPMALVILGGLASSTLLNLVVLPTLALRFGQFQKRSPDE